VVALARPFDEGQLWRNALLKPRRLDERKQPL
jgi:hypothetical protein